MTIFYDIDGSYRKNSSGGVTPKSGQQAIIQYIEDILMTEPGEALFNAEFKSTILDYIEGAANTIGAIMLRSEIFDLLSNHLVGIIIEEDDIEVDVDKINGIYEIYISYRENDLKEREQVVFNIETNR
jgi:phage baseplate assembly protein W